jgi:hypothetical protein
MSSAQLGQTQNLGKNKALARKEKKEQKNLAVPRQWYNLARHDPDAFSSAKWKALSRAKQEEYIQGFWQKPHKYLSLCYPNSPRGLSEAWDSLDEVGTIVF